MAHGEATSRRDSTDRILSTALQCIRRRFGFDVAFVSEFRDGRRFFRQLDAVDDVETTAIGARCDPLEGTYCQRIVDGRIPRVLRDSAQNPEAAALAVTHQLGIASHLGAPVRFSDGQVYGTLCCYSRSVMPTLSDADGVAVELLAEFLSTLLEKEAANRGAAESALQRISGVLEDRSFFSVYQPIVQLPDHRIVGYEALTRFTAEPARSPDVWFSEAAQVGLQERLEIAAAAAAVEVLPFLPEGAYLAINVSPDVLLSGAGALASRLGGFPLQRLVIEVTEHAPVHDYAALAAALATLRTQGVRLAVDDAGAGFASFRHVLLLNPDIIKIDGSLVGQVHTDASSRAVAAAFVRLAQETGTTIVAEGVETSEQLEVLRGLGVANAQGYLLGKPQPVANLQTVAARINR